jgi:hypothetical protein
MYAGTSLVGTNWVSIKAFGGRKEAIREPYRPRTFEPSAPRRPRQRPLSLAQQYPHVSKDAWLIPDDSPSTVDRGAADARNIPRRDC